MNKNFTQFILALHCSQDTLREIKIIIIHTLLYCTALAIKYHSTLLVSCTQTLTRRVWGIRPEVLCISECVNCSRG